MKRKTCLINHLNRLIMLFTFNLQYRLSNFVHLITFFKGDIILSINGREVTKSSDVYDILAGNTGSKDILMMHVWRGKLIKIAVTPEIVE